ncbi:alpha-1,2-fucosyltransferase [Vibrio brasiliensis]
MIIYLGNGGLGNQLYQLRFLDHLRREGEIIFSTSLLEAESLLEFENLITSKNKIINKLVNRVGRRILIFLSKLRVISSTNVTTSKYHCFTHENGIYENKKGLLPINYVYPCYCHHKGISNLPAREFSVKRQHLSNANNYWDSFDLNEKTVVGIHVRRNDYLEYSVLGKKNPSLPIDFFKDEVLKIREAVDDFTLLVFTDDREYVYKELETLGSIIVSDNNMYVDFALMLKCDYLIISPSTFSYWAAVMNKNAKEIIAPRYWLGWKSGTTYPKGLDYKNFRLVDVTIDECN